MSLLASHLSPNHSLSPARKAHYASSSLSDALRIGTLPARTPEFLRKMLASEKRKRWRAAKYSFSGFLFSSFASLAVTFAMSEPVTVGRDARACFRPQSGQSPVRQNESEVFAGDQGMKKEIRRWKDLKDSYGWTGFSILKNVT